ncbi:F0F1-ATPase subunit [Flavobacterium sp. 316]|uniref:AtpZ/AtpI family protein n=1 Tax=Flavobacterium sediminilitoris TaxID=2024526 RepID=A0ABY4HQX9_9FLAO|nr:MULTISPECIES: AtpZ/AtpI family protein [Flavobacterium]KIX21227.1 F0F1-ATPase subunit [Flavobacterium sp. 316]UOX35015.1 AtpZ/AtpI family protein [Flavobacterium sediminilitoris]
MNKKPNKWLSLITIPFQMGFTIFIAHYLGTYLDEKYQKTYYQEVCTLIGVILAIYYVVKQVIFLNKNDK